jgi:hypothetical protein
VPPGYNEQALAEGGFERIERANRTDNLAVAAEKWRQAREELAGELRPIEGSEMFEGQQRFLAVASRLAREGRLSRFAFRGVKSGG